MSGNAVLLIEKQSATTTRHVTQTVQNGEGWPECVTKDARCRLAFGACQYTHKHQALTDPWVKMPDTSFADG